MPSRKLLTAQQLATELQISIQSLRNWRRVGIIPTIIVGPGTIRFDLVEVMKVLRESSVCQTQGTGSRLITGAANAI